LKKGVLPVSQRLSDPKSIKEQFDKLHRDFAARCDEVLEAITNHEYIKVLEQEESSLLLLEAYHYFYSTVWFALECYLHADIYYPRFQHANSVMRRGLDNPDNLYLHAIIDPEKNYLVQGRLGEAEDIIFQVWDNLSNVTVSSLSSIKLATDREGHFEIAVGPKSPDPSLPEHKRNHLPNALGRNGDMVLVRYTYSLWQDFYDKGELHIDYADNARDVPALISEEGLSQKIKVISQFVRQDLLHWVDFLSKLKAMLPENMMTPLTMLQGDMGLVGLQYNSIGIFNISEDDALVLTLRETAARYVGFQLGNLWFQSLDYNRQTSLTMKQAIRSKDGFFRYVISIKDPGVANWVDTQGHRRGVMLLRYQLIPDGVTLEQEKDGPISMVKVSLREIAGLFSKEDRENRELFFPAENISSIRREQVEKRRRHLQKRFGY
jgi:hypothetical protein